MKPRVSVTTWANPKTGEAIPVIVYIGLDGKRKVRKFASVRDAYKAAEKVEGQLDSGVMADPLMTVGEYVTSYLASQEAKVQTGRIAKSTYSNCYYILGKHLVGKAGNRKLKHLNRPAIRDFLIGLLKTHAPTTAHTALAVIRSMFSVAVADGLLASNPCAGLGKELGLRASTGIPKSLSAEQVGKVYKWTRDQEPKYLLAVSLYLKTGMRLGEGLALGRSDFDYEAKTLHVSGNATQFGDVTDPKTDLSSRDVEIPLELADMIREELLTRVSPWILAPEFLSPPRPRQIKAARSRIQGFVERLRKGTKIEGLTLHWFRHTYATQYIEAGTDIAWVSRQLGHASIKTTMDLYGRGAKPKNPSAVEAMNAFHRQAERDAKYRVRVTAGV